MVDHQIVLKLLYCLLAAVAIIPFFTRLGLGSILGYLVAGIILGPWGCKFVTDSNSLAVFSELGIVLLFFIIGLEVSPHRLMALRNKIFVYGSLQMLITSSVIGIILYLCHVPLRESLIIAFALAISSTAYALNLLKKNNEISLSYGQASMGILLFQDLIVIPILLLIPLLSAHADTSILFNWPALLKSCLIFLLVATATVYPLKTFINYIFKTQSNEVFIAACLLIVLGTATIMNHIGFSMGLGAFMAGVFLANSEVKVEIEKSIFPFKSLLMGLFFIRIGMGLDFGILQKSWPSIILFTTLLVIAKFAIIFLLAKTQKIENKKCAKLGILLCEAGEFSFVILAIATHDKILASNTYSLLVTVVTLSMFIAPILYRLLTWVEQRKALQQEKSEPEATVIPFPTSANEKLEQAA